jgi:hypothetical protein
MPQENKSILIGVYLSNIDATLCIYNCEHAIIQGCHTHHFQVDTLCS